MKNGHLMLQHDLPVLVRQLELSSRLRRSRKNIEFRSSSFEF